MVIDWTCVLDDGSRPFAPELDADPRRPLLVRIGDDTKIRLLIVDPLGNAVDLGADIATNYPQLVLRNGAGHRILSVKGTRGSSAGKYDIAIPAATSQAWEPLFGSFALYSIQAAPARAVLIPSSELKIGR